MADEPNRAGVSEGVLLAAASAAGVWFAYVYESSRLGYYYVPMFEVPVTARHIAWGAVTASTSIVWYVMGAVLGKYDSLVRHALRIGNESSVTIEQRSAVLADLLIVGGVCSFAATFFSVWWFIGLLIVLVLCVVIPFLPWLPENVGPDYYSAALLFFLVCNTTWICSDRGLAAARDRVLYHTIQDRNLALVNSYTDRNVFAEYDPDGRYLTGNTWIITDTELEKHQLELAAIGPLKHGTE